MKSEGEARIDGAYPETRSAGRGLGRGSVSPSPENFGKIESEMVQSGAYFTSKLPDQAHCLICHFVVVATLLLQLPLLPQLLLPLLPRLLLLQPLLLVKWDEGWLLDYNNINQAQSLYRQSYRSFWPRTAAVTITQRKLTELITYFMKHYTHWSSRNKHLYNKTDCQWVTSFSSLFFFFLSFCLFKILTIIFQVGASAPSCPPPLPTPMLPTASFSRSNTNQWTWQWTTRWPLSSRSPRSQLNRASCLKSWLNQRMSVISSIQQFQ